MIDHEEIKKELSLRAHFSLIIPKISATPQ